MAKKPKYTYPNVIELSRHPDVPIHGVLTIKVGLPESEN